MKIIGKQNSQIDKMYLVSDNNQDKGFTLNIVTSAGMIVFETGEEIKEFLALIGENLFYISKCYLSKLSEESKRNEDKN